MRNINNVSNENIPEVLATPVGSGAPILVAAVDVMPVVDIDPLDHALPAAVGFDPYDDEAYFTRFPPASGLPTMEFISIAGSFANPGIPTITNSRPERRDEQQRDSQSFHLPRTLSNIISDSVSNARGYARTFFHQSNQPPVEENQLVIYDAPTPN